MPSSHPTRALWAGDALSLCFCEILDPTFVDKNPVRTANYDDLTTSDVGSDIIIFLWSERVGSKPRCNITIFVYSLVILYSFETQDTLMLTYYFYISFNPPALVRNAL